MKIHTYRGFEIKPWTGPYGSHPDRGEPHWFIQTHHHPTGIDWSPEHCPKAWSLDEAKAAIDEILRPEL